VTEKEQQRDHAHESLVTTRRHGKERGEIQAAVD
jgi:hypothetical protein